jgi:hypothetical protein
MNGFHYKAEPRPKPPARPPAPATSTKLLSASSLSLLYIILVHSDLGVAKHLIDALDEPQHSFIVHVDGKYDEVYAGLREFADGRNNVYLLDETDRMRANWGGFSIVNATLNGTYSDTLHLYITIDCLGRAEVCVESKYLV